MKKIKKLVIGLLALSTVLMAAFVGYERVRRDTAGPVIRCPESVLEAGIAVTEQELLEGVTARDSRDGQVDVVVEKLSPVTDNHQRIITYAAADRSGNVSRATRTLHYTDYQPPRFSMTEAPRAAASGGVAAALRSVRAQDASGKDLSARIRFNLLDRASYTAPGVHFLELRVTDSFGRGTVLPMEAELYEPGRERIQVELKEYLIYLPRGSAFEPETYFLKSSQPGTLTVDSRVDLREPGVYPVVFTVTGEDTEQFGRSRMTVVVE